MENPNLVGLLLCGALFLSAVATFAAEPAAPWAPEFIRSKVATTLGGYHATTRGTIRLVFPHENKWLVFRGDPNTYHFSGDGKSWSAAEAAQASRSHLICGNTIYTFYSVLAEPAPKWVFDKFVCRGTIAGKKIEWEAPHKLETEVAYYPDLKQDTKGHFTMTGRHAMRGENGKVVGTEVLWKRSRRPGDFTEWGLDVRCIHHLGDRGGPGDTWKRVGSTAHENLVLEGGKSYVIAMMTVDGVGKLYGNLFDGRKWGKEDTELATGMSTWAGTDRRMCAAFDRAYKIIHLAYVDGAGNLSYRSAEAPYEQNDWSKPIRLQSFKTFTTAVSLDTSQRPAHVYVLFGKTAHEDRNDLRNTWGALYLQRFDGKTWSEPVLVSEPGTEDNWYPNMNEDIRNGIGILYLKASKTRTDEKPLLDIMFASTGAPSRRPMALSKFQHRQFFGKRLEPRGSSVIHGAGQSFGAFQDYVRAVGPKQRPIIYMTYCHLDGDVPRFFRSLRSQLDGVGGRLIPQIGLSMVPPGGKPERHYEHLVAQGEYDEQIEQLCQALSELGAPAFVRIGYEFNGSWNGYEPAAYKAAWKHLVKAFRAHRLDNVAAVWCYVPRGGKLTYSFMDWYPGDEWVDWWGLDLFWPDSFTYHDALSFMDQAAKHKFPVMIGESTPRSVGVLDGQESWEKWFVPYFDFIRRYDTVKAFCYISWDWGGTGRWSTWGDARIEVNDSVLERYKKELSHENYLHGTSETDIRRDLGCDPAGK